MNYAFFFGVTKYPFLICWIYNHLVIGTNQFFSKFKWWPLIRMASWLANLKWLIKQLWIEVSVFFCYFFDHNQSLSSFFPCHWITGLFLPLFFWCCHCVFVTTTISIHQPLEPDFFSLFTLPPCLLNVFALIGKKTRLANEKY